MDDLIKIDLLMNGDLRSHKCEKYFSDISLILHSLIWFHIIVSL